VREAICRFLGKSQHSAAGDTVGIEVSAPPTAAARRSGFRGLIFQFLPDHIVRILRRVRNRIRVRPASPAAAIPRVLPAAAPLSPPRYWGLNELDRQIEKYLDFDGGYFVELGANDGRFQSNTLYYEQFRRWRGVLIEPSPDLCRRCHENRSSRSYVVNAACVAFGYAEQAVEMIYSNAMSVSLNLETDIGDPAAHAELGRQFLGPDETVFNFRAPARTLNSILLEANAPARIDFLSLDVEGAEIEVLKGVDHDAFRFRYMLIECRDIARLSDYLGPLRYHLVEKFNEHDYLFADEPVTA
jgi:FkbM family methyltransferase